MEKLNRRWHTVLLDVFRDLATSHLLNSSRVAYMMAFYTVKIDEQEEKLLSSADSSDDETLENQDMQRRASRTCFQRMHMSILYIFNALLLASVVVLCISKDNCKDPSLITYCKCHCPQIDEWAL